MYIYLTWLITLQEMEQFCTHLRVSWICIHFSLYTQDYSCMISRVNFVSLHITSEFFEIIKKNLHKNLNSSRKNSFFLLVCWHITPSALMCGSPAAHSVICHYRLPAKGMPLTLIKFWHPALVPCPPPISTIDTYLDVFHLMDLGLNGSGWKNGRTLICLLVCFFQFKNVLR